MNSNKIEVHNVDSHEGEEDIDSAGSNFDDGLIDDSDNITMQKLPD